MESEDVRLVLLEIPEIWLYSVLYLGQLRRRITNMAICASAEAAG